MPPGFRTRRKLRPYPPAPWIRRLPRCTSKLRNPPSRNPLKDRMPRIWNCCSATLRLRMPHRLGPRRLRRSPLWRLPCWFLQKGRRARKPNPAFPDRPRPRRKGLLRNRRKRCPLPHRRMRLPSRCRNLPGTARIGRLRSCPWLCRTFPSAPPCRKRSPHAAMKWKNVLSGWRKP